ncbi:MAG: hypothetical protein HETSPECPRED_005449, partial [Heterodermia speciosa]
MSIHDEEKDIGCTQPLTSDYDRASQASDDSLNRDAKNPQWPQWILRMCLLLLYSVAMVLITKAILGSPKYPM